MKTVVIENTPVFGIKTRTNNQAEMSPETAKIGLLWQQFASEVAPKLEPGSQIFGLYCNYESDHTGNFDVFACSDIDSGKSSAQHHIETGKYLVFNDTGEMPQVVIQLWQQVWQYFASEQHQHKRAFSTDFELYKSDNEVELYISIVNE